MDLAGQVEGLLKSQIETLSTQTQTYQLSQKQKELADLYFKFDELLNVLGDSSIQGSDLANIYKELNTINMQATQIVNAPESSFVKNLKDFAAEPNFADLVNNPLLARGGYSYSIKPTNSVGEIKLNFSNKLIREVFSGADIETIKSLKKMFNGVFTRGLGNPKLAGLARMIEKKGIFELRSIGGQAGGLRLYGYSYRGSDGITTYYMVDFTRSNDHGASVMSGHYETVERLRYRAGHDQ